MKRGRPTKLTPKLQETICYYIATGNTFERSCRLCDISDSIFFAWKAKGAEEKTGKYKDFLDDIKKAEEKFKATNVAIIMKAGQEGNWQASAWLLERKYYQEFGKKERREISGPDGEPVKIVFEKEDEGL